MSVLRRLWEALVPPYPPVMGDPRIVQLGHDHAESRDAYAFEHRGCTNPPPLCDNPKCWARDIGPGEFAREPILCNGVIRYTVHKREKFFVYERDGQGFTGRKLVWDVWVEEARPA